MLRSLPHPDEQALGGSERYRAVVAALEEFFDDSGARASAYGPEYVELWRELRRNTTGGKLFRPRMVVAAFDGLDGTHDEPALPWVGAAFELLHTALIVHDDVIDRDFVRRGKPNISGTYRDRARGEGASQRDAEHRGLSAAVVAGDLALFYSYRLIDRSGVGEENRRRLLELMDEALFASAAGELLDLDYSGAIRIPTVDNILSMARLKTAVYSFEVPLKAGAVLAGASDAVVESMGDFGREVGTAYQVVDDLLGVFGDSEETGKSTTSDLREGKRTVLVAHAAGTGLWAQLAPLFGSPDLSEADAQTLRAGLEQSGARDYAEQLLAQHVERAREVLARPHIPESLRERLIPIVDLVLRRGR
ncbi:polyprenyl synthetase family protein [Salinibacterium sp. SYSU T00001]|uniref:polyprenyl synthetase family protein n=1 Tax=Homoserinimonas sedimenticola TaxID=2986805 RepID=UPI0022369F4A|nr:polyprenyl synthetase family protein [Salinibacterium sedimenticola]MCW4385621.1 polyprenyl synthetase family protein [Salinibacterium sedimenticola]